MNCPRCGNSVSIMAGRHMETAVFCNSWLEGTDDCYWNRDLDGGIHRTTKLRIALDKFLEGLPQEEFLEGDYLIGVDR